MLGLTNLTANAGNHALMVDTGAMDLFCQLFDHLDIEIRNSCIFGVSNFSCNPNNHQMVLKAGCLPKLVAFLSCDDKNAQLRAVSALRGLSTDIDIRLDIIDADALDPLLLLAKSDDVEVQMETLACLCNLSLSGCIGDNPLSFLDACNAQNLIAFLCSADSTYRLFGAVALGNIASSMKLQDTLIGAGALTPLVTVSNAADLETQRCIAYALCNLAADPRRRADIVREGGLPALISMACSDDVSDQLAAMATIRGIAALPECRRDVYLGQITDALCLGVQADDVEIKYETAMILNAVSINDDTKLEMAANEAVMDCLLQELRVEFDARVMRQAMACLANMSERLETHPHFRRHSVRDENSCRF